MKSRMRKRGKFRSLSFKIMRNAMVPIFLASLVSCIVCCFFVYNNMFSTIDSSMERQWIEESSVLSPYVENLGELAVDGNTLGTARAYFESMAYGTLAEDSTYYSAYQHMLDQMRDAAKDYACAVWTADAENGILFTDSKTGYCAYDINCQDEEWYGDDIEEDRNYYISRTYASKLPGKERGRQVFSLVHIVRDADRNVTGYIGFDVMMSELMEKLSKVNRTTSDFYLFSDRGDFIYASSEITDSSVSAVYKIYEKEIQRESDEIITYKGSKENLLVRNYRVGENGFFCLMLTPKKLLVSRVFSIMLPIVIVFLADFAAVFFNMLIVTKRIGNNIKRMGSNIKKVGDGELDMVLDMPTQDEMGQLVEAFNTTVVRMRHKAEHDSLTDVYNHEKFCQEAEKMLKDESRKVVVIRLDIDQFKTINELFDWEVGNRLLKYIADVLVNNTPRDCIFGRQNGDIFHICLYYEDFEEIEDMIGVLRSKICEFEINLKIYPHFGICLCNNRDLSIHIVCDHAGIAIKQIKGNVLEVYKVYDNKLEEKIQSQKFVEIQKESAMVNCEFFVQMQPKTNMLTGKIVGAEALVRWRHPQKGIIRPDEFIPVFEKDGYILNLDEFVWEESCKYISKWLQKGIKIPVSVNVSRMHIFDEGFVDKLEKLTDTYQIPKELLELEFTESAMLDDVEDLYRVMEKLSQMGFPLVMDDFASGYSSLNMLKAIDFDVVKLDKEFVDEVSENDKSYQLVAATIGMLQKLNIKIVGEGIETIDQVEKLKNAGLVIAQGYYYSKPLNMDAFEEKLYSNHGYDITMTG